MRKVGMVVMVVVVLIGVLAAAAFAEKPVKTTIGFFAQVVTDKETTVDAGDGALHRTFADHFSPESWPAHFHRADFEKVGVPLGPVKLDRWGRALADVKAIDGDVLQKLGEAAGLDYVVSGVFDVSCHTVRPLLNPYFREASAPTTVVVRDIRKKVTFTWVSDPKDPPKVNAREIDDEDRRIFAGWSLFTLTFPMFALVPPEGEDFKLEAAVVDKAADMAYSAYQGYLKNQRPERSDSEQSCR